MPGALLSWLLAFAVTGAAAGEPVTSLDLEASAAWQGYLRPGMETEVRVRVMAARGGALTVVVAGSQTRVETDIAVVPGVPAVLRVPLRHDAVAPPTVQVYAGEVLQATRELALTPLPPRTRLTAYVDGGQRSASRPPVERAFLEGVTTHMPVTELPGTLAAYRMLTALVINSRDLGALSAGQQRALADYLGSCGQLYLRDPDPRTLASLRSDAGCGGVNILAWEQTTREKPPEVSLRVASGARALRPLLPGPDYGPVRALLVFLLAYLLLLWLVSGSAGSPFPVLLTPILAACLAMLGWSLGDPTQRSVSWLEMDSGDAVARFTSFVQISGTSRGTRQVLLDARWGIPIPATVRGDAEQYIQSEPTGKRLLHDLQTRLLSRDEYLVSGVTPAPALVLVEHGAELEVINRGETALPAGVLAWRGQAFRLPALAAGQAWSPPETAHDWEPLPAQQLLRQKAIDGTSWLLLPFRVPHLTFGVADDGGAAGWLLVRGLQGV